MDLKGQLIAVSPIYRGNATKTLFTRDGDGKQKIVSLPGEISGTAQGLMDAFIGQSKNGKNKGLLNKSWDRLFGGSMPGDLIVKVQCELKKDSYLRDRFFDLRMGIKLDEDRWAAKANENYKTETVFKNAVFDFSLSINDQELKKDDNQAKLFYLLKEIEEQRFWFGAGKSKGLGNVRLEMDLSILKPQKTPSLKKGVNHLHLDLFFDCMNPVLIGWNWGKKDPNTKGNNNFAGGNQDNEDLSKNQQNDLAHSDTWVDGEIITRQNHVEIKQMLEEKQINQGHWGNPKNPPIGIDQKIWGEFLKGHSKVQFNHMQNRQNLSKSIFNDQNMMDFLTSYRNKALQELTREPHIDFREGGSSNREISRKYGKPYDKIFMRMLTWAPSHQEDGKWEIYIPGGTIKGAFRKRASQILKTIIGESGETTMLLDALFGKQRQVGKILFSDAYLTDPIDEEKAWCSIDGVQMDPQTAKPFNKSKQDFLIAYGDHLKFHLKMDIQDISDRDLEALSVLFHLLNDFQRGEIPVGGDKNNGSGWVKARVSELTWLTSDSDNITKKLFGNEPLHDHGIWKRIVLKEANAEKALRPYQNLQAKKDAGEEIPKVTKEKGKGFISHRSFGGHCGVLTVQAEVLTPLSIRESGEPSFTINKNNEIYNGWDFFSLSPPGASHREQDRVYAIPSRTIKGMLRHIYSIASDSNPKEKSSDLSNLKPVESLFGYVGSGSDNALAGRLSVSFGLFEQPKLSWFEAPFFYGGIHYTISGWESNPEKKVKRTLIDKYWRIFPHTPLSPDVREVQQFDPNNKDYGYFRAVMPGSKARFTLRFWNITDEELQRLIWCISLEPGLANKMGNRRYLGFGSVRFKLVNPCFFIDWSQRYSGGSEKAWQKAFKISVNTKYIKHYSELKEYLSDAPVRQNKQSSQK